MNKLILVLSLSSLIALADVDYPKACYTKSATVDVGGTAEQVCLSITNDTDCNQKSQFVETRCDCQRASLTWDCQKSSAKALTSMGCRWNSAEGKCRLNKPASYDALSLCKSGSSDKCNNTYVVPPGGITPSPQPSPSGTPGGPDVTTLCHNMRATEKGYSADCGLNPGARIYIEWRCWTPSYPAVCKPKWPSDYKLCPANPSPGPIPLEKGSVPACIPK